MDNLTKFNQERWNALAQANVDFSKPFLDLIPETARAVVDQQGVLGNVNRKDVLCLASGGGQQSAAFIVLGANTTILDFSEVQLQRDQQVAEHYGKPVKAVQGDMRDLAMFEDDSFDVVWHAYSIAFIPDINPVFDEVQRVIRPNGLYRIEFHNPFFKGLDEDSWNGEGYVLSRPYIDGAKAEFTAPDWVWTDENGTETRLAGPDEFNHGLSTVVNGIIQRGFDILGMWEDMKFADKTAEGGTWSHFLAIAPPYLTIWAQYSP